MALAMPACRAVGFCRLATALGMRICLARRKCLVDACVRRALYTHAFHASLLATCIHACLPCEPARNKYTHAFHASLLAISTRTHSMLACSTKVMAIIFNVPPVSLDPAWSCPLLILSPALSLSLFSLSLSLSLPPPSDVLCEQAREANHCSQTCGPHARALSMQFCLCLRARAGWRQGIAVI